jgi:deoxyribodipyrimidine photo-lyase
MHDQRNDSFLSRRGRLVRDGDRADGPVVFWMSREQRVRDNWELLAAREEALRLRKPLAVVFYLNPDFPGASLRHYMFLLRGLRELQLPLARLGIPFHLLVHRRCP